MSHAYRAAVLFFVATLFLVSSALAQTLSPGGAWTVRDANNNIVGQYLGNGSVSTVINGYAVELLVSRSAISGNNALSFAQPNCQGAPFIAVSEPTFNPTLGTPAGSLSDGTLGIAPYTQQSVSMSRKSKGNSFACVNLTDVVTALPAQAGPNLNQQFTAPFSVVSGASAPMLSPMVVLALIGAIVALAIVRLRVG
jgi:hypothetical protein